MLTPTQAPDITVCAPTAFEAGRLRHALAQCPARIEVRQVGVGPAARFPDGPDQSPDRQSALPRGSTVILAGVAGALDPSLPAGSAFWASRVIDDAGMAWHPPLTAAGALPLLGTDSVLATPERKRAARVRTGASLADCESASFARVATAAGWRWGIVRGISDGAGDSVPAWMPGLLRADGSLSLPALALAVLPAPWRIPSLASLGARATEAMRAAGLLAHDFGAAPSEVRGARRVLLFGGTFDPPHGRHVAMASAAATLRGCDRIVVMPAGQSPLRTGLTCADAAVRMEMARRAFAREARASVSGREIQRGGTSYTVDTLLELGAGTLRDRSGTVLLIGSDQALQFARWREADRIRHELADLAVVLRPPHDRARFLREVELASGAREAAWWSDRVLPLPAEDLSATGIRAALAEGADPMRVPGLAPEVTAIILARGLYGVRASRA